jgi:hypothetical protein
MKGFADDLDVHFSPEVMAEKCADGSYAPVPKGWSALIAPCLYIAFPTVEEFVADSFLPTPGLYDMLDTKSKLQDAIAQYFFAQTKPDGSPIVDDKIFQYAVKRIAM